jgi:glycosidase
LGLPARTTTTPLRALTLSARVYKFWIALADIDGYRVDTVKHMGDGPTRYFASVIHEFGVSIGKEHFLLVGEVTGGRVRAFNTVETTGLDAALGIDDVQNKLEYLIKGYRNPTDYFDLFRNSLEVGKESHTWFRNKVLTMIDDHDQIRKGNNKASFCANDQGDQLILSANRLEPLHFRNSVHLLRQRTEVRWLRRRRGRSGPLHSRGHVRRRVWSLPQSQPPLF